ncbi:DUF2938 domain-containing protein [Pseudoalteromonas sp. SG41-2]|uniref:DUF2938 domain-containing protein n=1 Tax=Pseudoalteromonas sp. SG41-2 TaxID=2760978 RepID=UPI001601F806|nr:DUF2938 domain-containing protein [Pseudoalteromonas sp. SG41-2]MBB1478714.1 DUF2938 domain-containing protein [Pseudoalteromonas sp. SG41-2]
MEHSINWVAVIVIGVGATAVLDSWSLLLAKVFGVPSLNFCMVGRWISLMRSGQFKHTAINKAPSQKGECAIGWFIHYVIGVIFSFTFLLVMSNDWLVSPRLIPALIFGLATVCTPFFIMQPALGLGIAASKTPRPASARVKSCVSHCVFGAGIYISSLVLLLF